MKNSKKRTNSCVKCFPSRHFHINELQTTVKDVMSGKEYDSDEEFEAADDDQGEKQVLFWTNAKLDKTQELEKYNLNGLQSDGNAERFKNYLESIHKEDPEVVAPYLDLLAEIKYSGISNFGDLIVYLRTLPEERYKMGLLLIKWKLMDNGIRDIPEDIEATANSFFDDAYDFEDYKVKDMKLQIDSVEQIVPRFFNLFKFTTYARVDTIKHRDVQGRSGELELDEFTSNENSFVLVNQAAYTLLIFGDLFIKLMRLRFELPQELRVKSAEDQAKKWLKSKQRGFQNEFNLTFRDPPRDAFPEERFSFRKSNPRTKMLVYTMARSLLMTQINTGSPASQQMIWFLAALTVFRTQFFYYRDDKTLPVFPLFPILRNPLLRNAAAEQRFAAHGTITRPLLVSFPKWRKIASFSFTATDETPDDVELTIAYISPTYFSPKTRNDYTVNTFKGKFFKRKGSQTRVVFEVEIVVNLNSEFRFVKSTFSTPLETTDFQTVEEFCTANHLIDPKENLQLHEEGLPTGKNVVSRKIKEVFDLRGTQFKPGNTLVQIEHAPVAIYIPLENSYLAPWNAFFSKMTTLIGGADNPEQLLNVSLTLLYHTAGFSPEKKKERPLEQFINLVEKKRTNLTNDLQKRFDFIKKRQQYLFECKKFFADRFRDRADNQWDFYTCEGTIDSKYLIKDEGNLFGNRLTGLTLKLDQFPQMSGPVKKFGLPRFFSPSLLSGVRITANEYEIGSYLLSITNYIFQLRGSDRETVRSYLRHLQSNTEIPVAMRPESSNDLMSLIPILKFWHANPLFVKKNTEKVYLTNADGSQSLYDVDIENFLADDISPHQYPVAMIPFTEDDFYDYLDDPTCIKKNDGSTASNPDSTTTKSPDKRGSSPDEAEDSFDTSSVDLPDPKTQYIRALEQRDTSESFEWDSSYDGTSAEEYFNETLLRCFLEKDFFDLSRCLNFLFQVHNVHKVDRVWTEMEELKNEDDLEFPKYGFLTLKVDTAIKKVPFVQDSNFVIYALIGAFGAKKKYTFKSAIFGGTGKTFTQPVLDESQSVVDDSGSSETKDQDLSEPEVLLENIKIELATQIKECDTPENYTDTGDDERGSSRDEAEDSVNIENADRFLVPILDGFCDNFNSQKIIRQNELKYLYPLVQSYVQKNSESLSQDAYNELLTEFETVFKCGRFLQYVLYATCCSQLLLPDYEEPLQSKRNKLSAQFLQDDGYMPGDSLHLSSGIDSEGKTIYDSTGIFYSEKGLEALFEIKEGTLLPVFAFRWSTLGQEASDSFTLPKAIELATIWQYDLLYKARVDRMLEVLQTLAKLEDNRRQSATIVIPQPSNVDEDDAIFTCHKERCALLSTCLYGYFPLDKDLVKFANDIQTTGKIDAKDAACQGLLVYDEELQWALGNKEFENKSILTVEVSKLTGNIKPDPDQDYNGTTITEFQVENTKKCVAFLQDGRKAELTRSMLYGNNFYGAAEIFIQQDRNKLKAIKKQPYLIWFEECRLRHLETVNQNLFVSFVHDVVESLGLRKNAGYRFIPDDSNEESEAADDDQGESVQQDNPSAKNENPQLKRGREGEREQVTSPKRSANSNKKFSESQTVILHDVPKPEDTKTQETFEGEGHDFYDALKDVFQNYWAVFDYHSMCMAAVNILKLWNNKFGEALYLGLPESLDKPIDVKCPNTSNAKEIVKAVFQDPRALDNCTLKKLKKILRTLRQDEEQLENMTEIDELSEIDIKDEIRTVVKKRVNIKEIVEAVYHDENVLDNYTLEELQQILRTVLKYEKMTKEELANLNTKIESLSEPDIKYEIIAVVEKLLQDDDSKESEESDDDSEESEEFAKVFETQEIATDGSCLWRSVAFLVYGDQEKWNVVLQDYRNMLRKYVTWGYNEDPGAFGLTKRMSFNEAEFWFTLQGRHPSLFKDFEIPLTDNDGRQDVELVYNDLKRDLLALYTREKGASYDQESLQQKNKDSFMKSMETVMETVIDKGSDTSSNEDEDNPAPSNEGEGTQTFKEEPVPYIDMTLNSHISFLQQRNPWGTGEDARLVLAMYGLDAPNLLINKYALENCADREKQARTEGLRRACVHLEPDNEVLPIVGILNSFTIQIPGQLEKCDYFLRHSGRHFQVMYRSGFPIPIPPYILNPELLNTVNQNVEGQLQIRGGGGTAGHYSSSAFVV